MAVEQELKQLLEQKHAQQQQQQTLSMLIYATQGAQGQGRGRRWVWVWVWVVGVGVGPWVSRSAGARRSEMHDTRGVWRVALIRRMALLLITSTALSCWGSWPTCTVVARNRAAFRWWGWGAKSPLSLEFVVIEAEAA
jgi:hypothetical protein